MTITAPILNMSNIPGGGRPRPERGGPGRFQPSPAPSPIGWLCTCTCDQGCVVAQPDLPEGVSECFPYYEKQP